jgi:PleD family two-component response regulator
MGTMQATSFSSISPELGETDCPPGSHLGRIGGEEFLLLLMDVRLNDAGRVLDGMRAGFPAATLPDHASRRPVAFSAGLTEALPHDDRSSILYRADRALYAAKAEGRNRTRIGFGGASAADDPPTRGKPVRSR